MIAIIDYGMGNLFSVSKALERMNVEFIVSGDVKELAKADAYILPGVGAFKDAMHILNETGLAAFIKEIAATNGKPLLGICLGMQLLFEESEEHGLTKGLSLLKGKVKMIPGENVKVPHMGWNLLQQKNNHRLLEDVNEGYAYFVHSFFVTEADEKEVLAFCSYDVEIPAVVGRDHIMGTQFHPEKSSEVGLQILQQFSRLVEERAKA